jgi:phage N-6-adenine-methyltransferase
MKVVQMADVKKLAYVGRQPGLTADPRDSDAWFTPAHFIEKARRSMGVIDLDPFSSEEANRVVQAKRIFTKEDSAFGRRWSELGKVTVFMNPPYGRGLVNKAVDQFLACYYDGQVSKAVVLVNNATETAWFQSLAEACDALCLVGKRISFYNTDGKAVSGNTRGQVFLYYDVRGVEAFKQEFSSVGRVFANG